MNVSVYLEDHWRHDNVSVRWGITRSGLVRRHCLPVIGEKRLAELEPQDLLAILDATHHLHPTTSNKIVFNALRGLLRDATRDGYAPYDLVPRLYSQLAKKRDTTPSLPPAAITGPQRDAILRALGYCASEQEALFVRFLFYTGCRPSEAMGLVWSDLDTNSRRAFIQRGIVEGQVTGLKTKRSRRWIEIPESLWLVLMSDPAGPNDQIFSGLNIKALRIVWNQVITRLRITPPPRLYNTRHTFISLALSAGASLPLVAAQVGDHQSMVEQTYYRYIPKGSTNWDRFLDTGS